MVGHHADDEVLSRGPLVERHIRHRVRLDERLLRVVEEMAPRVRAGAVVARPEAEGLFRHPRAHRDARGRVVLGVRDEARGDAEDDHRVDLEMRRLSGDMRLHAERLVALLALELDLVLLRAHVHPRHVVPAQGTLALLAAARDVVGVDRDVRVLFLLRVDPLDNAVPDQVGEAGAPETKVLEVLLRQGEVALLRDEEGPADAAFVAVDDDLPHVLVVSDVDLMAEQAAPPPLPDLGDEHVRVLVEPDEVAVHVPPRVRRLLTFHLLRAQVREEDLHLVVGEAFGHVDDESAVLHQAAVLAFRRLVGAEPAPLRRVQVARLEMRLGPREGARHPSQVAQGGHVRGPIEQLTDARPPADPVPRRQGVEEALREEVRPDRGRDFQFTPPSVRPLELVLEVLDQVRERDPEEVLHEVPRELEALVRVVVLVVLAALPEGELEDRARDAAEEDRLLDPVFTGVAEVGEEGPVEDRLDLLRPVLLRLARRELLLQVVDRVVPREDAVRRVQLLVLHFLDVRVDDVRHRGVGHDRVVDLGVLLHPQCLHEDDQRDLAGCRRHGYDELTVLLLLHQSEGAVPLLLGEDLRDLDLPPVALVELHEDAVRREVLEGDERAFRAADDIVPARVARVLALLDELPAILVEGELALRLQVLLVQKALLRLRHDREVPDVDALRLQFDAVLDDREVEVNRRGVVQIPEAGFHGRERVGGAVRLLDDGEAEGDRRLRLDVDPPALVPLSPDPDLDDVAFRAVLVELDDPPAFVLGRGPVVVHDPLHPRVRVVDRGKEVIERGGVVVHDRSLAKERVDELAHGLPPDDEAVRFGHARGAAHAGDSDDPALINRALDPLEELDHRVAPPDLRQLVSGNPQGLQDPLRLFLGNEAVLGYELMLHHVDPQGRPRAPPLFRGRGGADLEGPA